MSELRRHTPISADGSAGDGSDTLERSRPARDRRKSPRKKVLLRGKLVCHDATQFIDCTIRDISPAGAGIRLFVDQDLPRRLILVAMRDGVAHEAEVRWQLRTNYGLRIHRSFSLDDPLPEEFGYLKSFWERGDLHAHSRGVSSPASVTLYKGERISVVPADGGFVAYARNLNAPVDPGINFGERISPKPYATAEGALKAAKTAIDTGQI